MSLVRSALEIGYELTSRLYRELYHHQDRSNIMEKKRSRDEAPLCVIKSFSPLALATAVALRLRLRYIRDTRATEYELRHSILRIRYSEIFPQTG